MAAIVHCLVDLVVKASALRMADLGLIPAVGMDCFVGQVTPLT